MNTPKILMSLVIGGSLLGSALADDPVVVEGDGMIYCLLHTLVLEVPCEPDFSSPSWTRGADQMRIRTSEDTSLARLTISWDARSAAADELSAFMHGNYSCETTKGEPACAVALAAGPSPLVLTLDGDAARDFELVASIHAGGACRYEYGPYIGPYVTFYPSDCDLPPFELIVDQPFHYKWELS